LIHHFDKPDPVSATSRGAFRIEDKNFYILGRMINSQFLYRILLLAVGLAAAVSTSVQATLPVEDDYYHLAPADTIHDDFFLATNQATISGHVDGDVFLAGRSYTIDGSVDGSVHSASQDATIKGTVHGSVRMAGQNLFITGHIDRNVLAFGQTLKIDAGSYVGRDVHAFVGQAAIGGEINGDLYVEAGEIVVSGVVQGDLELKGDHVTITAPAVIAGDIHYRSKEEIQIEDGVTVDGLVEWDKPEKRAEEAKEEGGVNVGVRIVFLLIAYVTGLIMIGLFGNHTRTGARLLVEKPLPTLGIGFISFLLAPVAILLLMVTVLGIPWAIILFFSFTVFFYIAKIYVAIAVGRLGIRAFKKGAEPKQGWSLLFGLIILAIVFAIPYLWWAAYLVVVFWGIGAILMALYYCRVQTEAVTKINSATSGSASATSET
jgi:cytoskeletal protein CcmA (bactofilin family)